MNRLPAFAFSDSRGRFFVRLSSKRAIAIRVALDEFIADGQYEVVNAPASVSPRNERENTPIRVVVRRLPLERVQQSSAQPLTDGRHQPND